jgi:hypothetical protein
MQRTMGEWFVECLDKANSVICDGEELLLFVILEALMSITLPLYIKITYLDLCAKRADRCHSSLQCSQNAKSFDPVQEMSEKKTPNIAFKVVRYVLPILKMSSPEDTCISHSLRNKIRNPKVKLGILSKWINSSQAT